MKEVDILVSSRDRHTEIALLMQSLRTQTHKKWNLFILDNASGTPLNQIHFIGNLINRLRCENHAVTILRNEVDFSICSARNRLCEEQIKIGTGEYSMRLDDDVIPEQDYIEKLVKVIEKGYDLASGVTPQLGVPFFERETKFVKPVINNIKINTDGDITYFGDDCGWCYLKEEIIPTAHFRSCALYKSEINKIKYPDNLSKYGFREESFLSIKLLMEGYKMAVNTKAIVLHLQTPSGGGKSYPNMNEIIMRDDLAFKQWVKKKYLEGRLKCLDPLIGLKV